MSFCRKMDGTGDHHVKSNKPASERQISCFLSDAELFLKKLNKT
jgi:hypothetical protein